MENHEHGVAQQTIMHIARVLGVACMVFSTVEATVYKVKIRSSDPLVFDPP